MPIKPTLVFLLLAPLLAHAQWVNSNPVLELLSEQQLTESLAQGATLTNQLSQLEEVLKASKEQAGILREAYEGATSFTTFDPNAFLAEGSAYFRSQVPDLGREADAFVADVTNGPSRSRARSFDTYRDAARALQAKQSAGEQVYDPQVALNLSRTLEAAVATPSARRSLLTAPQPSTVAEGLFAADLERGDPALLQAYLQRRARAQEAESQALDVLCEAMGCKGVPPPSVGKAEQLTAKSSAQATVELTRLNATSSEQLTLEQLRRQEEAAAAARARAEHDALWNNLGTTIDRTFSNDQPPPTMPVAPLQ